MPRCNLTLKQKTMLIELSKQLTTEQLAKRFHVHATTVTRTIKKKDRILVQASRVNPNFKTVQTNQRSEEHDTMVLDYIRNHQNSNVPISVSDICDKAVEFAKELNREIKSRRAWWRRFRVRCNVVRSKLVKPGDPNYEEITGRKVITLPAARSEKSSPGKAAAADATSEMVQSLTDDVKYSIAVVEEDSATVKEAQPTDELVFKDLTEISDDPAADVVEMVVEVIDGSSQKKEDPPSKNNTNELKKKNGSKRGRPKKTSSSLTADSNTTATTRAGSMRARKKTPVINDQQHFTFKIKTPMKEPTKSID